MSAREPQQHVDPETLAAFAEGRLRGAAAEGIVAHLDQCDDCASDLALGMTAAADERTAARFQWRPWAFALAAAVLVAVVAVPLLRNAISRGSGIDRLVALAPASERTVEPRLTGGFAWAAYAGSDRATSETPDAARMKLTGAAGELVENADREKNAESQHAAGVAMVLVQAPADAIARLEAAAAESRDAKIWSDLAAARYAAASQLGRASLYPRALAAADKALQADPKLPEALFNRALILERIGLAEEAKRAWQRYLEVDPSSPWAAEARARLAELPLPARSSQFDRDRPLLEQAAGRGDADAVRRYVDTHRDRARAYAEAEYLGRWGEALLREDDAEANRWLVVARAIGNTLVSLSGESLVSGAVSSIDEASPAVRQSIAAAHVAYRRGRIAYSKRELDAAQRDLARAAELFDAGRNPMALSARYYAAGVALARNETAVARAGLLRARTDSAAHPAFLNLAAHVRWELGRLHMLDDDWNGAAAVLGDGAAMFRRSGDRVSEAFVESLLARALTGIGHTDDAWLARMRAFAALSAEGENGLLATAIDAAMHAELLSGRTDAALALSGLELAVARSGSQPQAVVDALVTYSMLQSMTGNAAEGLRSARQAEQMARAMPDPALRDRRVADAAAAAGAALAQSDPGAATESLTRAIDFYRQHGLSVWLPEPLLLRARAGDPAAAMRDLEEGMAIVESAKAARPSVLDAEHALFTDAIALSLDRGHTAAAFAFAERSRRSTATLGELQRRLAGGVALIEMVALPDEVIVFAVTSDRVEVARRKKPSPALADEALAESGTTAAAALYDALIRPVAPALASARELVIVPDRSLRGVPFAALYDRTAKQHLIERFAVSIATDASSFDGEPSREAAPSITAMALPSAGATESFGLPEAERETGEVASSYARQSVIPASGATLEAMCAAATDVLHLAGHTERQAGGGEQALLLTAQDGVQRASWKTIAGSPGIRARTVVLAACETLRAPASSATQASSLGEAFAEAGAREVIGTLTPIGDRDARLLFGALHRLARGERATLALQQVQQEAIASTDRQNGRRPWRALAVLTRRH